MNTRYLFKAKSVGDGEWVQGYFMKRHGIPYIFETRECPQSNYEVDETTLCQCTGLKDKKGNLIWENDVVKDENGNLYKAFWQDSYYQFSWLCVKSNLLPAGAKWDFYSIKSYEIEVVGNIFDNPELLERKE